jgi:hypothetical protein
MGRFPTLGFVARPIFQIASFALSGAGITYSATPVTPELLFPLRCQAG